jgi:hypothetical protein
VTASLIRLASVLAPPLPDTLWVESVHGVRLAHEGFSAAITQCSIPLSETSMVTGHNHHVLVKRWCDTCFPGERCTRRVPLAGARRRRWRTQPCGQPSGAGVECRWHHNLDVTLDQRIGDAA